MVKHDSFVGSFGQNRRSTHFSDGMGLPFGQSLATSVTEVPNGHSSSEMHAKDMPQSSIAASCLESVYFCLWFQKTTYFCGLPSFSESVWYLCQPTCQNLSVE